MCISLVYLMCMLCEQFGVCRLGAVCILRYYVYSWKHSGVHMCMCICIQFGVRSFGAVCIIRHCVYIW